MKTSPMKRRIFITASLVVSGLLLTGTSYRAWSTSGPFPGQVGDGVIGPKGMVWIPAGGFFMGTDNAEAHANERPAHKVTMEGFWMDQFHVTNRDFSQFVEATAYVTTAERKPTWESLSEQLPLDTPRVDDSLLVPGALVFIGTEKPVDLHDFSQWWRYIPGASWRHPAGPESSILGKEDHPVVQVSYEDVLAYADWVGKRMPTEAEWEYAARGGLDQATYAWGDTLSPDGSLMANTWDNTVPFPTQSTKIVPGTTSVGSYLENGYNLYDMAGNAWQWVADWYRPDTYVQRASNAQNVPFNPKGPPASFDTGLIRADAPQRVIRGGSFLCSSTYCEGYRVSARQGQDPASSSSNVGFRLVLDDATWRQDHM